MTELKRYEVFHEIGHAIIGLIFDGYLMKFEKIILNKNDIKQLNLNPNDLAYTYQKGVIVNQELLDENEYLYAMINGLNFLGGIAGATFLCPEDKPGPINIDKDNFNEVLVVTGSSGDFEFINGNKIFYSWYLFTKNKLKTKEAYEVHAFLMSVLQDVFLDDRIRSVAQNIFDFIIKNPNLNVESEKLLELFPQNLRDELKNNLIENFTNTE